MAKRSASTKGQPAPEVLPAVLPNNPDLVEAAELSSGVTAFLAGMRTFFAKAAIYEDDARRRNETALAIRKIESSAQQADVQALAIKSREAKQVVSAHWKPVADITNRLHKVITGGRGRAEKLEDATFEHLNKLNNAFNAEQEAKARAEEQRLRREAEQRERERQAAEAAELERQAAEAEASSPELSARELAFVNAAIAHYGEKLLTDGIPMFPVAADLERFAARAGYTQAGYGARLWATAKIAAALKARVDAEATRRQAAAVAAAPVAVHVEEVKPDVADVAGTATRWKAKVVDRAALMAAVKAGAVPDDVFMVDLVKLGSYATVLKGALNHWPGVEAWDDTRMRR